MLIKWVIILVCPRDQKQKQINGCFLCCTYDVNTVHPEPEAHHHAATQSPTFLSHIRAYGHGEGYDFKMVCNYCKKSVVFVQTDTCE